MKKDLYTLLTTQIDDAYEELKRSNPFYRSIFDGEMAADVFTRFLANTSFLTAHTPRHLKEAAREARRLKMLSLCEYFLSKLQEELGHEKWGEDDIKGITGKKLSIRKLDSVDPQMTRMIEQHALMIQENPYNYFIYVLFAEYFTVRAGPECMLAVEKAAGIPQSHMSIIGKHAELDRQHISEWAQDSKRLGSFGMSVGKHQRVMGQIIERHSLFTASLASSGIKAA